MHFKAISASIYVNLAALLLPCVTTHPLARQSELYAGYGFVYFTGERYAYGEQIYFAVSNGNTPAAWTAVNGGNPVLNSTLGDQGVRDPYIIRHPNTGVFYVLATDLKMYGGGKTWSDASRRGSLSLAIWESPDLVNWSTQRLVNVSPAEAGMSWAPEATWDPSSEQFVIYWSSKLYSSSDTNHTGPATFTRELVATTTDFTMFSQPQIWINEENIDTTICRDPVTGWYHRFSKRTEKVIQERSQTLDSFGNWQVVFDGVAYADHGQVEGPLCFVDKLNSSVVHVWVDDLADRAGEKQGYLPYETSNISSGVWTSSEAYNLPSDPRHGTVFALTATEMEALSLIAI